MVDILKNILSIIYSFTNDYGTAIIIFTLLVKFIMLPLTIRQKKAMKINLELSNQVKLLKEKYTNNPNKANEEIMKLYQQKPKGSFGILIMLLQLPIFIILFKVFSSGIINGSSVLTPWIQSLSHVDKLYIIPAIAVTTQMLPSIFASLNFIKSSTIPKLNMQIILTSVLIGGLITSKLPAAVGLYYIINNITVLGEHFIKV